MVRDRRNCNFVSTDKPMLGNNRDCCYNFREEVNDKSTQFSHLISTHKERCKK